MSAKRIANLRRKLKAENLEGMIFTDLDQIRYLTGFTGSAGLCVITTRKADFFTDSRYTVQAGQQVKGARVHTVRGALIGGLKDFPHLNGRNRRLGFAGEHVTVAARRFLEQSLPDCLLTPADSVVAELGWVKEKSELASIERAVQIADIAYERILNLVAPGVRERELAAELEYQMIMLGSEKPPFRTIVASGHRSAMPHGVASGRKLKKGDFVTFDFGAEVDGYCSDITRTIVLGRATSRQKRIYNIVLRAQVAGIRKIRPGVTGVAVDAACRGIITRAGFGKNFGHGTGHGIGFCVHSGPRVSSVSKDKLKANNVITIEPGIYINGWGGVRIEDDVVVTRTGARVLNKAEKKLLEL
jgi:Xaa-Pro aminopeptidase